MKARLTFEGFCVVLRRLFELRGMMVEVNAHLQVNGTKHLGSWNDQV